MSVGALLIIKHLSYPILPTITRYRYNIARRHRLLHGRGAPISVNINNRLRVHHAKFEHFISFITSPHIIQDVPFGDKIIKLSTGEEITTPYVIWTMIPERIVQQYQQCCSVQWPIQDINNFFSDWNFYLICLLRNWYCVII